MAWVLLLKFCESELSPPHLLQQKRCWPQQTQLIQLLKPVNITPSKQSNKAKVTTALRRKIYFHYICASSSRRPASLSLSFHPFILFPPSLRDHTWELYIKLWPRGRWVDLLTVSHWLQNIESGPLPRLNRTTASEVIYKPGARTDVSQATRLLKRSGSELMAFYLVYKVANTSLKARITRGTYSSWNIGR